MYIKDELAVKIFTYIENNPALYKDMLFLYEYRIQSFNEYKGKTLGDMIFDFNGWTGICKDLIFTIALPDIYLSEAILVEALAKYAITYLTCFVAIDMFVSKYMKSIFRANQANMILESADVVGIADKGIPGIKLTQMNVADPQSTTIYFTLGDGTYIVPDKPLDMLVKLNAATTSWIGIRRIFTKLSELTKDKIEEALVVAGW